MLKKLNVKQQRFCEEYIIDLNGTQAAIRTGYSERTANEQAARLLADVRVQEYIQTLQSKRSERTEITADYMLKTIYETMERCKQAAPVLDRKGKQVYVETPDGKLLPAFTFDAKNVLKGADLLGKHLRLFDEKPAPPPAPDSVIPDQEYTLKPDEDVPNAPIL